MPVAGLANIPLLNGTCPGNISVHADAGRPIYINRSEAALRAFNNSYCEAKGSGVTISLSIAPDGSPSLSYTGAGGANGICHLTDRAAHRHHKHHQGACPVDVSEADRHKYPACN